MGFLSWLLGRPHPTPARVTIEVQSRREQNRPDRDYPLEVVGESYRQDALHTLAGEDAPPDESVAMEVTAELVREDDNPHDDHAVKVMIRGLHVGYLSRVAARRYRKLTDAPAEVPALIVGGWYRGEEDRGYYGVRLALRLAS